MPHRPPRRALMVVGMHRSGTSCVARIANLLGRAMPAGLRPPRPDNPTGFWEPTALSELNERILERMGTRWDDPIPLESGWIHRHDLADSHDALKQLLEVELDRSPDLVLKDPRLCRLLPLWTEILAELDCETQVLLVTRDVRSVAASLALRDDLPAWQSELLWLDHVLGSEVASRDDVRAIVRYEDVMRDWRSAFLPVAERLSLELPDAGDERATAIEAFVSQDLDHAPPFSGPPGKEENPWLADTTRLLSRPGVLEDAEAQLVFDRIRDEMVAATPYLASIRNFGLREADRARAEHATNEDARRALETERRVLNERLLDAERDSAALGRKVDVLRGVLERSTDLRDSLSERVDLVTDNFIARTSEIEASLTQRVESAANAESENRARLERVEAREREIEDRLAAIENLAGRVEEDSELRRALESAESARVAAEAELQHTRSELRAHSEALTGLLASRSWKLTAPLRAWKDRTRGVPNTQSPAQSQAEPKAWEELVTGHAFRQRFRSPVDELAGLGIGFFTYGRVNRTSVRVRLYEDRSRFRSPRLLREETLLGDEIRDGEASRLYFDPPIVDAARKSLSIEIESLDGQEGTSVSPAISARIYEGRILSPTRESRKVARDALLVLDFLTRSAVTRKAFAFVSGCPGGAYRYRCEHPAEQLRLRGYSVDVLPPDELPWTQLLEGYQVVVCHRVPHTPEFERFTREAAIRNVRVVFDTDDVVFAPEIENQIAALDDLSVSERALWLDGVERYRRSLQLCDRVMVSTPGLRRSISERFDLEPALTRNCASDQMVFDAEAALANRPRERAANGSPVRVAYLSGTATHERDFAECVDGLEAILRQDPSVELVLVGHIRVPEKLKAFQSRIEQVPLMPWQDLPKLYAEIDINLAPLEPDNEFTEGKSELKYFEAALLRVPTLASPVGGLRDAIEHGENGFLCDTPDAWRSALTRLVGDPALRERIGAAAYDHSQRRYTTRGVSSKAAACWLDLLGAEIDAEARLSVAFVVRAPIANTGGGYKKVFHLVRHLSSRGHEVTVYVEPIAHLEGRSAESIESFCRTHFDCAQAAIRVGHDSIADCDVAVATNWPTAYVVDRLANARLRTYLVQDDEAEFYPAGDPLREQAANTYALPLLLVGMGRYLSGLFGEQNRLDYPHVDFALDDAFFEDRAGVERKLARAADLESPSLIFFARPSIPRRAFDLGVAALTRFHRARPEVEIRLYGLEEPLDLPFPFVDLGVIDQTEAAAEMRRATIHLSFSRTNASTVMFEAMASGAVAVELDAPGVRTLVDDPASCVLCDDSAESVSKELERLFEDGERLARIARAGHASAARLTVENMCRQFEEILLDRSILARGGTETGGTTGRGSSRSAEQRSAR